MTYSIKDYETGLNVSQLNFGKQGGKRELLIVWNNSDTRVSFRPPTTIPSWVHITASTPVLDADNFYSVIVTVITDPNESETTVNSWLYPITITDRNTSDSTTYFVAINVAYNKPTTIAIRTSWSGDRIILPYNVITTPQSQPLIVKLDGEPPSPLVGFEAYKIQTGGFINRAVKVSNNSFYFLLTAPNTYKARTQTMVITASFEDGSFIQKEVQITQKEYPQTDYIKLLYNPFETTTLSYESTIYTIPLVLDKYMSDLRVFNIEGNITATIDSNNNLVVTTEMNRTNMLRPFSFGITGTHLHDTNRQQIYISGTQGAARDIVDIAADTDYVFEKQITNGSKSYPYSISDIDNNVLYNGNAFVNNDYVNIHLNPILNKFSRPQLITTILNASQNTNNFNKYKLNSGSGLEAEIWYNNVWLYDRPHRYETLEGFLNKPVSYEYVSGQIIPLSFMNLSASKNYSISLRGNYVKSYSLFNSVGSNTVLVTGGHGTFQPYIENTEHSLPEFKELNECKDNLYAIIYRNSLGGYDSVLFHNRTLLTDNIKVNLWDRGLYNTDNRHSIASTHKEVQRAWTLRTKWLKDTQVALLADLFSSNEVYLQKIGDYKLIPINITNKSYEHKTKLLNNNNLVSVTVTAEEARKRIFI